MATVANEKLNEIAGRIREMREIAGFDEIEMAQKTEVTVEDYRLYEAGKLDFPFTFIHKCALAFGVGITDLLEGQSARLQSYTVTRKGQGQETAREAGIEIQNLAPMFRKKIAEPYWVRYTYSEELQHKPIHLTKHSGQEFDFVMSGKLKVQIGQNVEFLGEGDSIYYNSSTPHGMIAVDGQDCLFVAVVLPGEDQSEDTIRETLITGRSGNRSLLCEQFIECAENENGLVRSIDFHNDDKFNFAFDIVDALAKKSPDKLALLHISRDKTERRFTFNDIKRASAQCANYFKALGAACGQ